MRVGPARFPVAYRKCVSHLYRWRSVRAQAHLPFWRRILVHPGSWSGVLRSRSPPVIPLLEVAPYVPPVGRGRGRGLLLGRSHQPRQIGDVGAGLDPRSDPSGFQRYPQPERHLFEQREAILPVAEVEGQTQRHLSPRDSPDSSRASSDVGAKVDSESVASDPSDVGAVFVEDLHLLGLVLDDLLQLTDMRAVVSFVRRQLRQTTRPAPPPKSVRRPWPPICDAPCW